MRKLSEYKTFIFDLDDTLYDYSSCDNASYDRVATWVSRKFNLDHERALGIINYGKINAKSYLDSRRSSSHCRFLYFQKAAELLNSSNVISDTISMYEIYNDTFYNMMKPFDWVTDFFSNHHCCICTNMIAEVQFNKIKKLGLDNYVKLIVTSEEADAEKPNDAIYILLANKLNAIGIDVSDCLFIGDNFENDVVGPMNLGFIAMHVDSFINKLTKELV
jgi:putative hydrolase of the HAD superfamily